MSWYPLERYLSAYTHIRASHIPTKEQAYLIARGGPTRNRKVVNPGFHSDLCWLRVVVSFEKILNRLYPRTSKLQAPYLIARGGLLFWRVTSAGGPLAKFSDKRLHLRIARDYLVLNKKHPSLTEMRQF